MAKVRNYGVKDVENWKFNDIHLPQEWLEHIGDISDGFRMIIHGKSGHGKTEYSIKLAKALAMHYGKVNYNNVEQGRSRTLQLAIVRNKMGDIAPGKFTICDPSQRTFEPWIERLKRRNSGRVIILDSRDAMKLSIDQFMILHQAFKHKGIVIIAWDDPFDANSKKIKYFCDIKVKVHNFRAKIASRYGGNKTFTIWKNSHNAEYDKVQAKIGDRDFESEYVEEEEKQEVVTPGLQGSEDGIHASLANHNGHG